jgi:GNAT superfamily N-acetyltransferase
MTLALDLLPDYKVAREDYFDVIEEGKLILPEHKAELALYDDIPLDPEYEVYESLSKKGMLSLYTVRVQAEMVGYAVYFVRKSHHYKKFTWSISDIILVRKPYRNFGLGNALFAYIENDLRAQGVDVIHTMTKTAHPELAMLLESRGHTRAEICYSKRL